MHTTEVLLHLKKHGQLLDSEIAETLGLPLAEVRQALSELSARGEISKCSVTKYNQGAPFEGWLCRALGYFPRAAPGRKPGSGKS
ncbi:MAG: transcriptional regulator [Proteobacteria bacterium]|nr:transcriptional regulator [Pseudomonadota bacterium]